MFIKIFSILNNRFWFYDDKLVWFKLVRWFLHNFKFGYKFGLVGSERNKAPLVYNILHGAKYTLQTLNRMSSGL